ncbi:MAG: hypothetical protein ABFS45_14245 [Pseudomonadota bacterium]
MNKVKRLIIVAAPSCCGKSTFINQLMQGELEHVEEQLGTKSIHNWIFRDIFLHEEEIFNLENPDQLHLILHYTIPYPAIKYLLRPGYDKKGRLTILKASDDIIFMTLYASPDTLLHRIELRRKRVNERREQGKVLTHKYDRTMRTLKRLETIYANPTKLGLMYNRWFEFCHNIDLKGHYLVNVDQVPRLGSISKWPQITDKWLKSDHSKAI